MKPKKFSPIGYPAKELIAVARAAHALCECAEESEIVQATGKDEYETLCSALDKLDELPELPEPDVGSGPAKAEHYVRVMEAGISERLRELEAQLTASLSTEQRLREELKYLRAYKKNAPKALLGALGSLHKSIKDADELACENKKLRAALQFIADTVDTSQTCSEGNESIAVIAMDAVKGEFHDPPESMNKNTDIDALKAAATRYLVAVAKLGEIKNGKSFFEGSPTKDEDCYLAWVELNDAGVALATQLAGSAEGAEMPDQLLDVHAICEQRDRFESQLAAANARADAARESMNAWLNQKRLAGRKAVQPPSDPSVAPGIEERVREAVRQTVASFEWEECELSITEKTNLIDRILAAIMPLVKGVRSSAQVSNSASTEEKPPRTASEKLRGISDREPAARVSETEAYMEWWFTHHPNPEARRFYRDFKHENEREK